MRACRASARIPFFRLCCTVFIAAAVLSADAKKHSNEERPEWIAQPKSSDLMYLYVVGHAAGQSSETDAQDAAYQNALQKIAAQIPTPNGKPVSPARIQRTEVVPGCRYVEEAASRRYEAWVQVSWPTAEKQKLISQLEKDGKLPPSNTASDQNTPGSSAPVNSPSANPSTASSPDGVSGGNADTGNVQDNTSAQANKFQYVGQAVADPRKAEMEFTIKGNEVTGKMSMQSVREPNVRLAGARLTFSGTVAGSWEGDNTLIEGSWTGADLGDQEVPNDGSILIRIKKPGSVFPNEVHVRLTGRRGQYGWAFPASGKVGNGKDADDGSSGINPFSGKLKEPAICASIRNREQGEEVGAPVNAATTAVDKNRESWKKAQESLPAIFSLNDSESRFFNGVIHVNVKQKKTVYVGTRLSPLVNVSGEPDESGSSTKLDGPLAFFYAPSRVFIASHVGKVGIEVEGVGNGVGKITASIPTTTLTKDGRLVDGMFYSVFVVVVHEKDQPNNPKVEIQQVEMFGQAVRKEDGSPVTNAIVGLTYIAKSGTLLGYGPYPSPTTDAEGKFRVNLRNLPKGRFEVVVQLLNQVTGPDETGVENDLWPFKQHVVDLTPELAAKSPLNVGVIVLERVRWIKFSNRPVHVIAPTGR